MSRARALPYLARQSYMMAVQNLGRAPAPSQKKRENARITGSSVKEDTKSAAAPPPCASLVLGKERALRPRTALPSASYERCPALRCGAGGAGRAVGEERERAKEGVGGQLVACRLQGAGRRRAAPRRTLT